MKPIQDAWMNYQAKMVPEGASKNTLLAMRLCFYMGAWELFNICMKSMDPDDEPTPKDLEFMEAVIAELKAFETGVKDKVVFAV